MDLENLHKNILKCWACFNNFNYIPNPIFQGNSNSLIMQISQSPSKKVHNTSKPWNDLSGRKLIYDWYGINDDIFYNANNFYITDLSHCYPGKNNKG